VGEDKDRCGNYYGNERNGGEGFEDEVHGRLLLQVYFIV
jgi:uncharacterized protein YjbJ (UPF0337 family)